MNYLAIVQLTAVLAFTLAAMVTDLKWRRIPNWLTVTAFVLGVLFHLITGGVTGLLFALGGFAVGFGFLLLLWLIGGGGGGDVKLMGAVGAWMGAKSILIVFVLSALLGFACLLAVMGWNLISSQPATVPAQGGAGGSSTSVFKRTIPYAVPAGLAAWVVLLGKLLVNAA